MGKSKYEWWSFALAMIRKYPARSQKLKVLRQQNVTASVSGMPRSGGVSRTAEVIALRELPKHEQRKYEAVHAAILRTESMKESRLRMDVIRKTLWGNYRIAGAAYALNISDSTAQLYRWDFVMMVGVAYDLIPEEEYQEERLKRLGKKKSLNTSDRKP